MKNNGFTLVELLGVVIILSMLGIVIVPSINNVISDSKRKLYDTQINNIKVGASNYVNEHIFELDFENNDSIGITLGFLKQMGYVDDNISDPIKKSKFSDDMIIVINNNSNAFSYVVCDGSVVCNLLLVEIKIFLFCSILIYIIFLML